MPGPAESLIPYARLNRGGPLIVACLAAAGLMLSSVIGLTLPLSLSATKATWWHSASYLASLVSWPQWLGFILWAALTGVLLSAGVRRRSMGFMLAFAAVLAGALVPVGLVLLAGALNRLWPGTTGPTDVPALTLMLLAYSILIPWLLGRIVTRVPGVA